MVSSQLSGLMGCLIRKPFHSQLLLPMGPPDVVPSDNVEFDFSDVFGPVPVQASLEVSLGNPEILVPAPDVNKLTYDDPVVIYSRSHSLVGPTTCACQSLKLSKLTLHETEDSLELVACVNGETVEEFQEPSIVDGVIEKPLDSVDNDIVKSQSVELKDFEVLKVVGQGAFAKVFQVRMRGTSEIYAMKVMRKDKIMEKNHVEYMKAERDILTQLDHPFIVQLRYSFQLYHHGLFREDLARIYSAEIVSAVSHLHVNGIMHRDLKPENIILDADGHAMLTDFGLAKQFAENTRSNSMCGTLEYMSPEIVLGKGHDKAADWWSVGILLFEMLTGKLLQKEASKRLGSRPGGSEEIKRHKWFKSINWKKLEAREIQPSFRPEVAGKQCIANFEERWTNMPVLDSPAASPKTNDSPFKGFTYVRPAAPFLERNGSLY
ncbi:hypothetical protein HHK36_018746 [Tetracentron sinense]|uniref:Uncharacterized protein n=1 Tax=Tetracentron sinense TaxID=13715 RepID=A0A834YW77_TETSI|nr:hypothetical protein HHK36_018746 [Tetracentron sinense]